MVRGHPQQHCTPLLVRCGGEASALDVGLAHGREIGVHAGPRVGVTVSDWAQRVDGRHEALQPHGGEPLHFVARAADLRTFPDAT